ncbi:MAG: FG-GAP repeat protein, partial [Proteobacteria bacterium]|nr:FG-GAP repeat protein [Pseudomonadota bacterium]
MQETCNCPTPKADKLGSSLDALCVERLRCELSTLVEGKLGEQWDEDVQCYYGTGLSKCTSLVVKKSARRAAKYFNRMSKGKQDKNIRDTEVCRKALVKRCGPQALDGGPCLAGSEVYGRVTLVDDCNELVSKPTLEEMEAAAQAVVQALIDEGATPEELWEGGSAALEGGQRYELALGCSIAGSGGSAVRGSGSPPVCQDPAAYCTGSFPAHWPPYDRTVDYCGRGNSNNLAFIGRKGTSDCLNCECYKHDYCYGDLVTDRCLDDSSFACPFFTPQHLSCDQPFFSTYYGTCSTLADECTSKDPFVIATAEVLLGKNLDDPQCQADDLCTAEECDSDSRCCSSSVAAEEIPLLVSIFTNAIPTCKNGKDDDCDGLADCDDDDCKLSSECQRCGNGQCDVILLGGIIKELETCSNCPQDCARPEVCSDAHTDDDCDLLYGCDDPDCVGDPVCPVVTTTLPPTTTTLPPTTTTTVAPPTTTTTVAPPTTTTTVAPPTTTTTVAPPTTTTTVAPPTTTTTVAPPTTTTTLPPPAVDQKLFDVFGAAGDSFGWSVSISANTALVGARGDDC